MGMKEKLKQNYAYQIYPFITLTIRFLTGHNKFGKRKRA
jgi:hypothetical protein